MHIPATAHAAASERLMQRYYRTKQAVRQFNAMLLQNPARPSVSRRTAVTQPLNERFVSRDGLLEARDELLFEQQPAAILESFLLLEQHPGTDRFFRGHPARAAGARSTGSMPHSAATRATVSCSWTSCASRRASPMRCGG